MPKKLSSFEEFAAVLAKAGADAKLNIQKTIAENAVEVQAKAKEKFGNYQPAFGPYPAWAELKEATIAAKEKAGGGEDPLIGHYQYKSNGRGGGDLRNSITVDIGVMEATVGTNDPIAPHHEFGAPKRNIPPRPYLRPALYEQQPKIILTMKTALAKAITESG